MLKKPSVSFVLCLVTLLTITGCRHTKKIDVTGIEVDIEVKRFEKDLFNVNFSEIDENLVALRNKYKGFFEIFNGYIINIGNSHQPVYPGLLQEFVNHYSVQMAYKEVVKMYGDFSVYQHDINEGFKYFKYYFPGKHVPEVVTFVGGFSQSIVVDDSLLAIGLDNYLGAGHEMYKRLMISGYIARNMNKDKIVPDCFNSWLTTEFVFNDSVDHVLAHMIYQGKILYAVKSLLPATSDSIIIGFTSDQMGFCKNNIDKMWTYLVEYQKLFSSDRMDINQLINDAPFTSGFTNKSPGRAAVWIGWQIVNSYMKNNDISLAGLMENDDYMSIYNNASFTP